MNNANTSKTKSLFLACTFVIFCLLGMHSCNSPSVMGDFEVEESSKKIGEEVEPNPCPDILESSYTATILPHVLYPTFDLAIKLEGTMPVPPTDCICVSSYIEIELSTGLGLFSLIGATSDIEPGEGVDVIYTSELIGGGAGKTNGYTFYLVPGASNILLFNFKPGIYPTAAFILDLVESAGGICIVDNIHQN